MDCVINPFLIIELHELLPEFNRKLLEDSKHGSNWIWSLPTPPPSSLAFLLRQWTVPLSWASHFLCGTEFSLAYLSTLLPMFDSLTNPPRGFVSDVIASRNSLWPHGLMWISLVLGEYFPKILSLYSIIVCSSLSPISLWTFQRKPASFFTLMSTLPYMPRIEPEKPYFRRMNDWMDGQTDNNLEKNFMEKTQGLQPNAPLLLV